MDLSSDFGWLDSFYIHATKKLVARTRWGFKRPLPHSTREECYHNAPTISFKSLRSLLGLLDGAVARQPTALKAPRETLPSWGFPFLKASIPIPVGIPGVVNVLCDNALLIGYALERKEIDGGIITGSRRRFEHNN